MKENILKPSELKKREDIVKGMKSDKSGFIKRYGNEAEDVMYASATKKVKKLKETEMTSDFKISPELAFKIYNILTKQYPDIYRDYTKSSFFNYINSNLNESKNPQLKLKSFIKEFFIKS
jgi:putative IMPACT (imprinted ancient) family translation regulator